MSLQPNSQPEARSLVLFLLSGLSLRSLLTQFTDIQDKVRDLPHCGRGPRGPGWGSGSTSRPDHTSSTLRQSSFFFTKFSDLEGKPGLPQPKQVYFKGCRKKDNCEWKKRIAQGNIF